MKTVIERRYQFDFPSGTLTLFDEQDAEYLNELIVDANRWRGNPSYELGQTQIGIKKD
jgi:hypothetical protein